MAKKKPPHDSSQGYSLNRNLKLRATERGVKMREPSVHPPCEVQPTQDGTSIRARETWREARDTPTHPTRSPDLSISRVFSHPE